MSETVNDSDSYGGSFSEISDSNMCKVNSPFSSSSRSTAAKNWKSCSQNLKEARREYTGPFLNAQIQILS